MSKTRAVDAGHASRAGVLPAPESAVDVWLLALIRLCAELHCISSPSLDDLAKSCNATEIDYQIIRNFVAYENMM